MFVLIIANFILLCLYLISTPVANVLIGLKKETMDIPNSRIRAERVDINFDQVLHISHEPQRVKLYKKTTLF